MFKVLKKIGAVVATVAMAIASVNTMTLIVAAVGIGAMVRWMW